MKTAFSRGFQFFSLLVLLSGCAMPPPPPKAEPVTGEHGMEVLRALPADGSAPLYNGAVDMNVPTQTTTLNDVARMLAGMQAQGADELAGIRRSPAWQEHAQRMDWMWQTHLSQHRDPIQQWASGEISDLRASSAVFYPFSGPDFLFADAFFPGADTYILCGLEGAEPMPQLASLTAADIQNGLAQLRSTLNTSMQFSYFITKDMRSDLQATRFRGVLPVLMVFLARTGHQIESVDTVQLDAGGNAVMAGSSGNTGLLIRFRGGWGSTKHLFYFRQDLSNGGLGNAFPAFVARFGRIPAFTKSASYLMHDSGFTRIRDFLMSHSIGIVQDPTGVPYATLLNAGWDIRLFGNYQGTLDIFPNCQQPDLIAAYQAGRHGVRPLNFGIGYLFEPSRTSLMVARPRRR